MLHPVNKSTGYNQEQIVLASQKNITQIPFTRSKLSICSKEYTHWENDL